MWHQDPPDLWQQHPWPAIGQARKLSPSFTLEDAWLVTQWLEECVETHRECGKDQKSKFPTRVLAVGSDQQNPFLWDGAKNASAPYVALSHCWGDEEHPPLTTTKGTLEARKERILLEELPQTFRDAVFLTRKLGFDYLWIDSVCIIQDDEDDWVNESAQMAGVYQGAILTISADGAHNSHEGLFSSVSNRSTTSIAVEIPSHDNQTNDLYARMSTLNLSHDRAHRIPSAAENPLRRRAWALQEWILSPRIVYFAKGELLWECDLHQRCECQNLSTSGVRTHTVWRSYEPRCKFQFFRLYKDPQEQQPYLDWYEILEEFTRRRLTYPKDSLPALAGLAKVLNDHTEREYIGGLCKNTLPRGLLWRVDRASGDDRRQSHGDQSGTKRRDYPYAPSWSWASVIGVLSSDVYPIAFGEWNKNHDQYTIDILDISVEPVNATNPFGPLLNGFIKAKGFLTRLPGETSQLLRPDEKYSFTVDGFDLEYDLSLDVTKPDLEITNAHEAVFFIIRHEKIVDSLGTRPDRSSATLTGLCLKQAKDKHCYQRVGRIALHIVGPPEMGIPGPRVHALPGGLMYLEACYRILDAKEETFTII